MYLRTSILRGWAWPDGRLIHSDAIGYALNISFWSEILKLYHLLLILILEHFSIMLADMFKKPFDHLLTALVRVVSRVRAISRTS